jgi:N-acetylglucosaminyldiphosphoundecaprenol N-acetyl-beta-D-mannosaminyltransferase
MPELCARAAATRHGVYLFGAQESVNDFAAKELVRRFPGLTVAGRHHGYVDEQDMPRLIEDINRSGAAVLFVALGSPRQELWMGQYRRQLRVGVCQGLGGTFDVIAGRVRRAPPVFISLNLEWLYRLISKPRRLLRQTALPRFTAYVVWAALRGLLPSLRK